MEKHSPYKCEAKQFTLMLRLDLAALLSGTSCSVQPSVLSQGIVGAIARSNFPRSMCKQHRDLMVCKHTTTCVLPCHDSHHGSKGKVGCGEDD